MCYVNVRGIDRTSLITALFNVAAPVIESFSTYRIEPVTAVEMQEWLSTREGGQAYFIHVMGGRWMHFSIDAERISSLEYDAVNGPDMMEQVVNHVRETGNCWDDYLAQLHLKALARQAQKTYRYVGEGDFEINDILQRPEMDGPNPRVGETMRSCLAACLSQGGTAKRIQEWNHALLTAPLYAMLQILRLVTDDILGSPEEG